MPIAKGQYSILPLAMSKATNSMPPYFKYTISDIAISRNSYMSSIKPPQIKKKSDLCYLGHNEIIMFPMQLILATRPKEYLPPSIIRPLQRELRP